VTVPSIEQEAARDLVLAREDCRGDDLMAARQRLSNLLLRQGIVYYDGHRLRHSASPPWIAGSGSIESPRGGSSSGQRSGGRNDRCGRRLTEPSTSARDKLFGRLTLVVSSTLDPTSVAVRSTQRLQNGRSTEPFVVLVSS
jgi:hypothetical protein